MENRKRLNGVQEAGQILTELVAGLEDDQERLYLFSLDKGYNVIATDVISIGTEYSVSASPRTIFMKALERKAAFIIIGHNHSNESGLWPSFEDYEAAKHCAEIGDLLEIYVLAELIGNGVHYLCICTR